MSKLAFGVFVACLLLLVVHFVGCYFGHYGFDDLHYAELAHEWLSGHFDPADHYSYRWTLLGLTSLSYALFGIHDWSSALPALLVTAGILYLLYRLRTRLGEWVAALAMVLTVTSPWLLFYADKLMPDIYVAAGVALAWYALFRGRTSRAPLRYGLLLAMALLLGFLSKGTIILLAPVLLAIWVRDLLLRRALPFWRTAVTAGFGLGAAYLLLCWGWLGDPLIRFFAIADNSYLNACSYDQQPWPVLRDRLLFDFWELVLREGFAPLLAISLAGSCFDASGRFWYGSALGLFLAANFMTTSPGAYVPMCLDPRHYLYLIPIGAVAAGLGLDAAFRQKKMRFAVLVLLLLIAGGQWWQSPGWYAACLTGLALLWGGVPFGVAPRPGKALVLVGTILIGGAALVPRLRYQRSVQYREQVAAYEQRVRPLLAAGIVYTDAVQRRLIRYHESFDPRVDTRVLALREVPDSASPPAGKAWLYLNGHTRYLTGSRQADWPLWLRGVPERREPVWEHGALPLALYSVDDQPGGVPRWAAGRRFTLGFEGDTTGVWKTDPGHRDSTVAYAGAASERVAEFSATLSLPLAALPFAVANPLAINSRAQARSGGATTAQWVVAVEAAGQSLFWEGTELAPFFRIYERWSPIEVRTIVHLPADIPAGATLQVYLWNPRRDPIWLDELAVTVAPVRAEEPRNR